MKSVSEGPDGWLGNFADGNLRGDETIEKQCYHIGPSILPKVGQYVTLDSVSPKAFKKIYCSCGRIVDLDRKGVDLKEKLGKNPECIKCRNVRISREIDALDAHFDGTEDATGA